MSSYKIPKMGNNDEDLSAESEIKGGGQNFIYFCYFASFYFEIVFLRRNLFYQLRNFPILNTLSTQITRFSQIVD